MELKEYNKAKKIFKKLDKLVNGLKDFMKSEGYLKLESNPFMDLTIEKLNDDQISLCHYGEQSGDLMRDPEMIILIDFNFEIANAICYENNYSGKIQFVKDNKEAKNLLLQKELNSFLLIWLKNLKEQEFYK